MVKILLITILLSSCAVVKVKYESCKSEHECTKLDYWSKNTSPNGIYAEINDMIIKSSGTVTNYSPLEQAAPGIIEY